MIKNKRIIVFGGAGSIGSELVRQLAPNNKVFVFDISENAYGLSQELKQKGYWVEPRIGDIRNKETIQDIFEDFKPQIVFHCAAYKEVSPLEKYNTEAIFTNIVGTDIILHEAYRWECLEKFVFISSDKSVNANCFMGISKRAGEIMVKNRGGIVVRFANVLGSRGSLMPIWQRQIDNGESITVTDKRMTRYFMTIPQACELVIKAAIDGKGGEIFIMKMGKSVNIMELAQKVLSEAGSNVGIKEIGIRPGETLEEKLMSSEESLIAKDIGDFWVIK